MSEGDDGGSAMDKKKVHRERHSGRKAEKKKVKKSTDKNMEISDKQKNPKAFAFNSAIRAERKFRRKQDIETKKQHIPLVDRTPVEPPPILIAVVGPPKVGKSTVINNLIRLFTKSPLTDIKGPVTIVTGKKRRITLVECNNDVNSMIDIAKVADLVLLLCDASFGFEMEVFEFLNICQVHGMPRIMGVLTHLDMIKNSKTLKNTKKILKHRFWTEVYSGAKLFYLSGILHGEYLRNEIKNLGRFISIIKFRPLTWRTAHSYLLGDRYEDLTNQDLIRRNPKCDRNISLYGYVRGVPLVKNTSVHVAGLGDLKIHDITYLPDPCPLPDVVKKRSLIEKEKLIYAPFSGVGGIVYDKDAVYVELGGSHSHSKALEVDSMVTNLIDTKQTLDMKMQHSEMQIFTGGRKLTAKDVKERSSKNSANSTGNNVPKEVVDSDLDEELDELRKEQHDYTGLKQETIIDSSGRSRRKVIFNDNDDDFAEKLEESDQEDDDYSDEGFEQNKNTVYTVLKDNKDQTIHDKVTNALKILERNKPSFKPSTTSDFEENSVSSDNDDSELDDESFEDSNESDNISLASNESLVGVTKMKKNERIINVEDISIAKEKKKYKGKKNEIKMSINKEDLSSDEEKYVQSSKVNEKTKKFKDFSGKKEKAKMGSSYEEDIENNFSSDEENCVQLLKTKKLSSRKNKLKKSSSTEQEIEDNASSNEILKINGKAMKIKDFSNKKKTVQLGSSSEDENEDNFSSDAENCTQTLKTKNMSGKKQKLKKSALREEEIKDNSFLDERKCVQSENVNGKAKKKKLKKHFSNEEEIILKDENSSKSKKNKKAKEMEVIEEEILSRDDSIGDKDFNDVDNIVETEEIKDESGEEDMAVRWKENLGKKARDAFLDRQKTTQNIMKLVYGVFDKHKFTLDKEGDVKEDTKEEEDIGGLFKLITSAQRTKIEEKEKLNSMESSLFKTWEHETKDWLDPENKILIDNCFVTGKWKQSEDASELLKLDDMRDFSDDSDVFGDFEDLETGEKHTAEPKSSESSLKRKHSEIEEATSDNEEPTPLNREALIEKKRKLKEKFDSEYDNTEASSFYDDLKTSAEKQAQLNKEVFDNMPDDLRVQIEGFRPGMYVRIEFEDVPSEFVTNFDPTYPLIIGALNIGEENIGYVNVKIKKHRWHKKILKTADPIIVSLGWRRFQTIPLFSKLEDDLKYRYLKYTPEHVNCNAHFWGPITPQGTGFLALQSVDGRLENVKQHGFRIAATGSVQELEKSTQIMKKLKLIGHPLKIYKKTAFIKDMFNSPLEVAKFEGAKIQTVSGIRGQIKKAVSKPEGCFRATFEDKILLSDIVFCRTWYKVDVPKFYCPVTTLLLPQEQKISWQGVRTTGQLKREKDIKNEPSYDSLYTPIEREPKVFKPLVVPRKLQRRLPYRDKPKFAPLKSERKPDLEKKRVAVVREPHEQKVANMLKMLRASYEHKQTQLKTAMSERVGRHQAEALAIEEKKKQREKKQRKQIFRSKSKAKIREEKKSGK